MTRARLLTGLILCAGLWAYADSGSAQPDPQAEHDAVMAMAAQGFLALNEAENAPDKPQACDAYRRAEESLKIVAQAIARLNTRLDKRAPGTADLAEHLKGMASENRTALKTAEAGIRRSCS